MQQQEIYYATSNPGKFEDVRSFLEIYEPSIRLKQFQGDIDEIQSLDQRRIAEGKAKTAYDLLQKPVLIDDAAIYFDKYHEFPGTITKYVHMALGFEGIFKLVEEGDRASFRIHMVFAYGPNQLKVFDASCHGTMVRPQGEPAQITLPWKVAFVPDGSRKTYAEMQGTPEMERYNYRLDALRQFLNWYRSAEGITALSAAASGHNNEERSC